MRVIRPAKAKTRRLRVLVISGIGNAYADEVLFAARVYPFRKRKALSDAELHRIHEESRRVVLDAMEVLKDRMGHDIHRKTRDFLKVHNRGGEPCPRCGHAISQVTANRRITSYCRRCQPGLQSHYPRFTGAPSCRFRTLPRRPPSVDSG